MDSAQQRRVMVATQLVRRGISDEAVLRAMTDVPREEFVAPAARARAYEDGALAIDAGQTISQPYIVALMAEALVLGPNARVLEVGAGSGYGAAVLSRIAKEVHAIERHAVLADAARERLARLGFANVQVHAGDGTLGWPAGAPYDGISVTAAGPSVPGALVAQLALGGRLVIPVGPSGAVQQLVRITRMPSGELVEDDLGAVQFVPLIAGDVDAAARSH